MPSIVIVGGGPRGVGVLERLGANIELFAGELDVHLVDPFPVGAGRVWRFAQSPLLRMNSMAEDVTMFTDESVACAGPIRPGPSLSQWARQIRTEDLPEDVREEAETLTGTAFPTRRLQSAYLTWFYEHTVAGLPRNVRVHVHQDIATRISDDPQTVWLKDNPPIKADVIVFTVGHLDNKPKQDLETYAQQHGLFYLPPEYSADADLSGIRPGQDVLMRGFGLAFIDLMVLLTEGRGGKYRPDPDGSLTYLPSGEEPRLIVGSRRGVPYHAKTNYRLKAGRPPLPRFFVPDAFTARGKLDFHTDVWPLLAKDIAWGHYHELFNAHADRVTTTWSDFAERFSELTWGSHQMRTLISTTVPREEDRLDFEALDRPLTQRFDTPEALQEHLRTLIRQDIDRRHDEDHSQDLGAFMGLLAGFGGLAPLAASGKLTTTSLVHDLGWWQGFFNLLASGPPGHRLEELLALSRAGIVEFLGADMQIQAQDGVFTATTSSHPKAITATALVEARLPKPRLTGTTDELIHWLNDNAAAEVLRDPTIETGRLVVTPADLRVVDREGRPHPSRFALGPLTNVVAATAFARPHTNAPAFRQNDAVARAILRTL